MLLIHNESRSFAEFTLRSFASLRMTALFPFFNKLLTVEITITGYQVTFRASWISRAGVPVEVIRPAPGTGFPSWLKRLILLRG